MSEMFDKFCEECLEKGTRQKNDKYNQLLKVLKNSNSFIEHAYFLSGRKQHLFAHDHDAVAVIYTNHDNSNFANVNYTGVAGYSFQIFDFDKKQTASLWILKNEFLFVKNEIGQELPAENIYHCNSPSVVYNKYHEALIQHDILPKKVELYPGDRWVKPKPVIDAQLKLFNFEEEADELNAPLVVSWPAKLFSETIEDRDPKFVKPKRSSGRFLRHVTKSVPHVSHG